ncbi:MAG: hypothetical protein IKY87_01815 [Paludibacteraceae bacterium]|nr:hypothetical protein [Paludibacteraceae bacterium]
MNKNVNVFIGVLLCAVLCGMFVWLSSTEDADFWSPSEMYNEVSGTSAGGYSSTSATLSGYSNDGGLALGLSSSSLSRARSSSFYAGAYSGAATMPLTSNLSPLTYGGASGAGLHLTSSAEVKSFGGGGNGGAAMGGSARSAAMSNSQSPVAHGAMAMSPITYTAARMKNTPSVDPATVSSGDMMAVMSANYGMGGYTASVYGGSLSGTYDQYVGVYGGTTNSYAGITGRRNSGVIEDRWYSWLSSDMWGYGSGSNQITEDILFRLWFKGVTGEEYDPENPEHNDFMNSGAWESFRDWFDSKQDDTGFGWYWMPMSDAIPFLLLLCVLWAWVIYRRTKSATNCEGK